MSLLKFGKDSSSRQDTAVGCCLLLLVLLLKANILNLPYHWDEMGAYITPSFWLSQGNLLRVIPGLHPQYMFFGHPPALYLMQGIIFKLFGEQIWLQHLLAVAFSFLGVYFTYLLASHLFGRIAGLMAALLLFFTPLYFAQSGIANAEIFITALGVMCVYFAVKDNYAAYLFCGIFLVLIKESAAALIAAVMIYVWLKKQNIPGQRVSIAKYSIPLGLLVAFFLFQKAATGMFLPNPFFISNHFFNPSSKSIGWVFFKQGRILLSCLLVANLIINRPKWRAEYTLFSLIFLFFAGTFSCISFGPRYILATLPYLCICSAGAMVQVFRRPGLQLLTGSAFLAFSISLFYGSEAKGGSFEETMQYEDVVLTHKAVCAYIEEAFPGKSIRAEWPLVTALSYPHLGYVNKPVKIAAQDEPYDIAVYTRHGHPANEGLRATMIKKNLSPVRSFEINGKYSEVYETAAGIEQ